MTQTITLSKKEMDLINNLLSLTGSEIYQKYGYKRDEVITHTAKFPDGIEIDIKLVICEDDTPYTEACYSRTDVSRRGPSPDIHTMGNGRFILKGQSIS